MSPKGILLSLDHLPNNSNGIRASGILFDNGLILTNGTILTPLIHKASQKNWLKIFLKTLTPKLEKNEQISSNLTFKAYQELEDKRLDDSGNNVKIIGAWNCPLVSRSLANLFHDWTLGDVTRGKDISLESDVDIEMSKKLMSVFILLESDLGKGNEENTVYNLSHLLLNLTEAIRGQNVLVESTPFGNELFFNSLSRGIISNVVGNQRCLMLTDARAVVGCEGGPIFAVNNSNPKSEEKGKLIGLVGCSLTWWRGEWVGLTIGINLSPVLRRLIRSPIRTTTGIPQPNIDNALSNDIAQNVVDETVVLVRCGCSWGSGVVLDSRSGIVVTCSHVVRNESTEKVSIFHKGNSYSADVVFRTRDNLAFDLAILKTNESNMFFTHQIEFSEDDSQNGEAVIAAGFPLLSEREDSSLRPTLVHGCVARTRPFMLQTTCCVQSGASGGALLRDGKLLGIIVCNARDSSTGALFPHVNFAIPVKAFKDQVLKYIETGDVSHLEKLESTDPKIQSLWRLQTSKL